MARLKQRVESLEREVETSKNENKGWIKKWGVYFGLVASLVAVPKAAKEALDSWYQRPNVKIQPAVSLTLTLDSFRNALVFSFPVNASNYGNRIGSIFGGRAHLTAKARPLHSIDAARTSFKLADENKVPGPTPFPVPAGLAKTLTGFVEFGENAVGIPDWYMLEVSLVGEDGKPLPTTPMRFCFNVTSSQIENLSRFPIEHVYPDCEETGGL